MSGASPKNEVHRIRIGGRFGVLSRDQLKAERNGDLAGDLVLDGEQITDVAIEPLGPSVRVALGVDQLGRDPNLLVRSLDAPLQHVAHAELSANLLAVDRLVPIGERRVARNYKHVDDAREIERHILGNAVGEILLVRGAAKAGEGQHDNQQARCRVWIPDPGHPPSPGRGGNNHNAENCGDHPAPRSMPQYPGNRDRRVRWGDPCHRRDKAIAPPGNGLDAAGSVRP